jgi:nucleoside-diphosphate-sugar epimerase
MLHTILGAGGSIGNSLAAGLLRNNENVRLVSRHNFKLEGAESMKGDLLSYADTLAAAKGSDVIYLCAGLKYDTKIWTDEWPKIMSNIIGVCKNTNIKLIFFDNVYMYGKVDGKMIEGTPYNPCSKKGEIRAKIATMLQNEMKAGNIKALIARAADLYGPYCSTNSIPHIMVINNLMKGKAAKWMLNTEIPHSFTYTIDCAKAMFILAQNEEAFGQVWHMPTCNPPLTGKMFIEMVAEELGVTPKYSEFKKWTIKLGGLFDPTIKEAWEMLYQNEFSYYFDSSKFETLYEFKPISYEKGIKDTIKFLKTQVKV